VKSGSSGTPYDIKASVLGGSMSLKGELQPEESFKGELRLDAVSFRQFAAVYAPGNESEGDITGHFNFTGKPGNWKALRGNGVLIILNGNLYAIPVLGPLTPLLGTLLPGQIKGYNVAREANCNFSVADGFIITEDFEALTAALKVVANGSIDYINDNIDFTAQARIRGLPGLVLRPVSELLEFKGEGSIAKPHWRPHYLSVGQEKGSNERKPPVVGEPADQRRVPDRPVQLPLGRMGR
jgi:hypothetical protein